MFAAKVAEKCFEHVEYYTRRMPIILPDSLKEKIAREMASKITDAFRRAGIGTITRAAQVMVTDLIPQNMPRQPVDRGIYKAGWRIDTTKMPKEASLVNTVPYAPIIEYGARAENIKVGKRMLDALEEWVIRKGIGGHGKQKVAGKSSKKSKSSDAKPTFQDKVDELTHLLSLMAGEIKQKRIDAPIVKDEKGRSGIKAVSDADARRTAWAIAMAMKKNGIFNQGKGYRLAQKLAEKLPAMFRAELTEELKS